MKTLIRHGNAVFEDRIDQCDIMIENGLIAEIGTVNEIREDHLVIDATGLHIFPGFIDIHTHLDDIIGRYYLADTYRSGTQIAVENGITTLFNFITQGRDESLIAAIERAKSRAYRNCHTDYHWHLTPTQFDDGSWIQIENQINQGFVTLKFYTTYRNAGIYIDYQRLEEIIKRLSPQAVQFLIHCEDEETLNGVEINRLDLSAPFSHAQLRPKMAELQAISRVLALAEKYRAHVHIVHVSTPEGIELIEQKRAVAPVTCETAPHYLWLNWAIYKGPYGHRWICSPPLRNSHDQTLLREKAKLGTIDLFATDHCAFLKRDKDNWQDDFREVPNGVAGIGALPHLIFALLHSGTSSSLVNIGLRLSTNPAKVARLYPRKGSIRKGSDADLAIVHLNAPPRAVRSSLSDAYETYPDHRSVLDFRYVFLRGQLVAKNNAIVDADTPKGIWLGRN